MGKDDLYAFQEREIKRLSAAVKHVESMIRGKNGTSMGKRIPGPSQAWVEMQGCMHHDKTEKTLGWRVMMNTADMTDEEVLTDKDFDFEIYPGTAKGIWFKGDVIKIEFFRQQWQPVAWGRHYFEITPIGSLAVNSSTTVSIGDETITVAEKGFAGATITGKKMGFILAHKSPTDFDVEWRPIIAKC